MFRLQTNNSAASTARSLTHFNETDAWQKKIATIITLHSKMLLHPIPTHYYKQLFLSLISLWTNFKLDFLFSWSTCSNICILFFSNPVLFLVKFGPCLWLFLIWGQPGQQINQLITENRAGKSFWKQRKKRRFMCCVVQQIVIIRVDEKEHNTSPNPYTEQQMQHM